MCYRRFTLTTDAQIKKEDVVDQHERTRAEGLERRQSRRLRLQLEEVAAGVGVSGCVKGITAEGILVTINSLGPMEVMGLIHKQDLPEQFQLPEHIGEAGQADLLRQDFISGRRISCIVSQVHPHPRASSPYNLKLDFDKFDEPPPDFEVTDLFDSLSPAEQDALLLGRRRTLPENSFGDEEEDDWGDEGPEGGVGDELEDGDEGDSGDYEAEVRDLFEELVAGGEQSRGEMVPRDGRRLLPVEDLYAWDALQDLIEEGRLAESDMAAAVRSVGAAREARLSFEQFERVVEYLQDRIQEPEDGSVDDTKAQRDRAPAHLNGLESEASQFAHSSAEGDGADDGDGDEGASAAEDVEFDEAVEQIFDSLKGPDGRVTVKRFREWEDLRDLVEMGAVQQTQLDALLDETVGGQSPQSPQSSQSSSKKVKGNRGADAVPSMDQEQFRALLIRLDDFVGETVGYRDDPNDEHVDATTHEAVDEDEGEEDNGQDDGDREALRRELFDELCNVRQRVPVQALMEWEEIAELLEDKTLSRKDLQSMLKDVGSGPKGELDFEQFSALLVMVEEAAQGGGDDDSEEGPGVQSPSAREVARSVDEREIQDQQAHKRQSPRVQTAAKQAARVAVEGEGEGAHDDEEYPVFSEGEDEDGTDWDGYAEDGDEEEPTEEELQEMSKLIFEELKPAGKKTLPVETFVNWQTIEDELQAGTFKNDDLLGVLRRVDAKKTGQLTFEQFVRVMDELEEIAASRDLSGSGDDDVAGGSEPVGKGFGQEAPVPTTGKRGKGKDQGKDQGTSSKGGNGAEEQIAELTAELYQELKGKVRYSPHRHESFPDSAGVRHALVDRLSCLRWRSWSGGTSCAI